MKEEAAVIRALTAQHQKLVSGRVGDQSLDLGHTQNISDRTRPEGPSAPEQRLSGPLSRVWDTLSSLL